MVHCWIESISFPNLFWKIKTMSEIQIGITFLIIGIFWCGFQHFVIRYKLFHFNSLLEHFHMIFKVKIVLWLLKFYFLGGCLKFLIFFWVNGRCWARVYVWWKNESTPPPSGSDSVPKRFFLKKNNYIKIQQMTTKAWKNYPACEWLNKFKYW